MKKSQKILIFLGLSLSLTGIYLVFIYNALHENTDGPDPISSLSGIVLGIPVGLFIVFLIGRHGFGKHIKISAFESRSQGLGLRSLIGMSAGLATSLSAFILDRLDLAFWLTPLLLLALSFLVFAEWRLHLISDDYIKSIDQTSRVLAGYSALVALPVLSVMLQVLDLTAAHNRTLVITMTVWTLLRILIPMLGFRIGVVRSGSCEDDCA